MVPGSAVLEVLPGVRSPELDNRRDMLFSIIACSMIVELLYGLLALYGTCSDWLNGP